MPEWYRSYIGQIYRFPFWQKYKKIILLIVFFSYCIFQFLIHLCFIFFYYFYFLFKKYRYMNYCIEYLENKNLAMGKKKQLSKCIFYQVSFSNPSFRAKISYPFRYVQFWWK